VVPGRADCRHAADLDNSEGLPISCCRQAARTCPIRLGLVGLCHLMARNGDQDANHVEICRWVTIDQ
jgi:hypothetical protein